MTDTPFLMLNDRWRLAYDPLQWCLQCYRGIRKAGPRADEEKWESVSFIATRKVYLTDIIREKGIVPAPDAQKALDALPDTFREWASALHRGGAQRERPFPAPEVAEAA